LKTVLLDTNIIIYALNELDSESKRAQEYINQHIAVLAVADQNINEALRVLTHPKYKRSLDVKTALEAVNRIADECIHISPNIETRPKFYELVREYNVSSNNIYDAYLVATALTNSIYEIVTHNVKDFQIYTELAVLEF
jgi:predicted nucleic acid-binding protein